MAMRTARILLTILAAWSTAPTWGSSIAPAGKTPEPPPCCCGSPAASCSCGCAHGPVKAAPVGDDSRGLAICACIQPLATIPPVVVPPRPDDACCVAIITDPAQDGTELRPQLDPSVEPPIHPPDRDLLATVLLLI
jgi:hypothetical protein